MSGECPNCGGLTNSTHSRLIKDTCGHEKCRMCLLYEEKGCKACSELRQVFPTSSPGTDVQKLHEKLLDCSPKPPPIPLNKTPTPNPIPPLEKCQENPSPSSTQFSAPQKLSKPTDRNHIITLPGHPERYKCTICQKIFRNKKGKCYHDVCRTGISPYHCTLCDKTFVKKSHFEYHERVHSGYKPFECEICSKAFPQKNKLNRHMQSHDPEKKFLCSVCGKRYNKKDDLTTHLTVHSGAKPHMCSTCGKSFRVRTSLNRHMRIHSTERPFTCDNCGKSFKDKSLLARHKRTHGKDRPYSCAHCPKVFLSKSELRRHISSHSDVKPFGCKFCETVFRRKDNLIRHIRHHHMTSHDTPASASVHSSNSSGAQQQKPPEGRKNTRETREKTVSSRKVNLNNKPKKSSSKTVVNSCQVIPKDSTTQINSRMDARGIITPVIRVPGELSNAVPVINGPISIRRPWEQPEANNTVLTYTQPIPIAEALVINQRIEEKLYLQSSGSNSSCFFRERSSREPHIPISILPPLGQNSAIRAVPSGSQAGARRMSSDLNFSPPTSGTLIELKSAGSVLGDQEVQIEEHRKKCTIVMDERVNIHLAGDKGSFKAEGTNCVSTIKKNFGFEGGVNGNGVVSKASEIHWRRRTSENLKPHHN